MIEPPIAFYAKAPNKLMLFDNGVCELLSEAQESYFDHYEEYLIEKLTDSDNSCVQQEMKEHLQHYYEFIYALGLQSKLDHHNVINESEPSNIYQRVKAECDSKSSKPKDIRCEVQNVVKANCVTYMLELNKKMMEFVNMDEEFKAKAIAILQGNSSNE
jgi:hypothetical protein